VSFVYTNAWCLVEFRTRNGTVYTIDPLEFPFITSVQVTQNLGVTTEMSIAFEMPFDIGLKFLNSEILTGVLATGTIVRVRMGYGAASGGKGSFFTSGDFLGFLAQGGAGLELSPSGLSGSIAVTGGTVQSFRSAVAEKAKLKDAFDGRVTAAGFSGYSVSPEAVQAFNELMKLNPSDIKLIANGEITHADFIDFTLNHKNLSWYETATTGADGQISRELSIILLEKQPDRTSFAFVMRGGFDYEEGQIISFPITSFSPSNNGEVFMFGAVDASKVSQVISGIDKNGQIATLFGNQSMVTASPTTDKEISILQKPTDQQSSGIVANRTEAKSGNTQTESGRREEPVKAEANDFISSINETMTVSVTRFVAGLTATLVSFGIPHIVPNIYVKVVGVGSFYEGIYYVEGVSHTWSGADIETTLTLRSRTASNDLPQVNVEVAPSANIDGSP
jgi:hypothetical protein